MKSIRIRNMRCILDTGDIEMKPINILVGANGSGKSSILRAFPLLRQSIDTPTDSPLLWFGRLVDYGSIKAATNTNHISNGIDLSFKYNLSGNLRHQVDSRGLEIPFEVGMKILENSNHNGSFVSRCDISLFNDHSILEYNEAMKVIRCSVNSIDIPINENTYAASSAFIVPSFQERQPVDINRKTVFKPYMLSQQVFRSNHMDSWYFRNRSLEKLFLKEMQRYCHGNTREERALIELYATPIFPSEYMLSRMKSWRLGRVWVEAVKDWTESSNEFQRLRAFAIACFLPMYLNRADEYIAQFSASVKYLGPIRATARRYYRVQDLSVNEIDYQGENLPMFLRSLSDSQRINFSDFIQRHFGFSVEPTSIEGHIAINIQHTNGPKINMADTGFGYSQLLPVAAQVWASTKFNTIRNRTANNPGVLAFEQPELHLHPGHQAALADLFVGAIDSKTNERNSFQFVVETHSEALINRMGALVSKGFLSPEDIQILIFNKEGETSNSSIQRAYFDTDGALCNWPFGFFAAE